MILFINTHIYIYYKLVKKYDSNATSTMDEIVLDEHLSWIKDFNQSFLKGIAHA